MGAVTRAAVALGIATRSEPAPETSTPEGVQPPSRSTVLGVAPSEALTLDAIYRAFFILQACAMQITMDVWRGGQKIETPSLVARPDVNDHQGSFFASSIAALAARGNFYWRKHRGSDGTVINLEPLDPLLVLPWRDKQGRRRFAYKGKDYTPAEIAHGRLLRVPGLDLGLGPIQAAARSLRGNLDIQGYGSNWFRDSEIPEGLLTTDQPLTAAQAGEWKTQWKAARANTHDTAVLGNGLDYRPLMLKPAEAQWLEAQKFGTTSIARLMGMTPRQLLTQPDGNSLTYSNAAQDDVQFIKYTLMMYIREIELVLSDVLPRGQVCRANLEALLRTDTKTRFEAHKLGIDAGWLRPEEVRDIEGLTGPAPAPKEQPANA